jgi:uncharacterized protein YndB with AHSA1/START domain
MTPPREPDVLVVRRTLAIPRERVFAAWLDPVLMARWMCPGETRSATVELEPRVGGKFRILMHHGGGDPEHTGEYLVIDPPARLSFTWISAATEFRRTIVTVELFERGAGTELVLTHRDLPSAKRSAHEKGWSEIVEKLAAALNG